MNNHKEKLKIFLRLLLVIIIYSSLFIHLGQIKAQTLLPLTVAPARQELIVDPGETTAVNVRFYNTGDTPLSGFVKIADFIVEDNQGSPKIIEDISQAPPRFTASNWFTLPFDKMTIAANDKVSLQAKIKVPKNATAGGRYVAIYFEPTVKIPQAVSSQKEAGTGITPRIASLIFIRVSGPIKESAFVSRFFTKSFWEYGPIEVTTEILNRGDYHIRPKGIISLINVFGGLAAQEKLKEENIFPDRTRIFTNKLGEKWLFGRYRLDLAVSYGEQGKALTATTYVWVFPWRVTVVVVLSLIIIILLGKSLYKKILVKEQILEEEIEKEKEEIEKLRKELKKRSD